MAKFYFMELHVSGGHSFQPFHDEKRDAGGVQTTGGVETFRLFLDYQAALNLAQSLRVFLAEHDLRRRRCVECGQPTGSVDPIVTVCAACEQNAYCPACEQPAGKCVCPADDRGAGLDTP